MPNIDKFAVLIHGKGGSPNTSWLPWIRQRLEERGFTCSVPAFPPGDDSKLHEWFDAFRTIKVAPQNTTFVAHARGAMALLRWINTLPPDTKIHQLITVSCNFDYQPDRTDGDEFYLRPLDYEDIKHKCQNIVVIHSEDDPYVPTLAGEELSAHLSAKFARYKTAGHFGSDKIKAPEILKEII